MCSLHWLLYSRKQPSNACCLLPAILPVASYFRSRSLSLPLSLALLVYLFRRSSMWSIVFRMVHSEYCTMCNFAHYTVYIRGFLCIERTQPRRIIISVPWKMSRAALFSGTRAQSKEFRGFAAFSHIFLLFVTNAESTNTHSNCMRSAHPIELHSTEGVPQMRTLTNKR